MLFASYVVDYEVKEILIVIAPLLDETSLDVTEHQSFTEATLHYYDKTLDDVVAFVGNNCTVNRKP